MEQLAKVVRADDNLSYLTETKPSLVDETPKRLGPSAKAAIEREILGVFRDDKATIDGEDFLSIPFSSVVAVMTFSQKDEPGDARRRQFTWEAPATADHGPISFVVTIGELEVPNISTVTRGLYIRLDKNVGALQRSAVFGLARAGAGFTRSELDFIFIDPPAVVPQEPPPTPAPAPKTDANQPPPAPGPSFAPPFPKNDDGGCSSSSSMGFGLALILLGLGLMRRKARV